VTRRLQTGAAVVLAAISLAACGGDDDSLPATPVVPTETEATVSDEPIGTEEFIAAGDEICSSTFASVAAVETASTDDSDRFDQRADLYSEMLDDLQSLGTPDDGASVEDLYTAASALVTANEDAATAAAEADPTAIAAAEDAADAALDEFESAAAAIGFEDCSDSSSIAIDPSAPTTPTDPAVPTVPTEPVPTEPVPTEPVPTVPTEPVPTPEPPAPITPPSGGGATPPPPEPPAPEPPSGGSSGGISPG
jgi:hypothetical protein